jgi:hypothetical protein
VVRHVGRLWGLPYRSSLSAGGIAQTCPGTLPVSVPTARMTLWRGSDITGERERASAVDDGDAMVRPYSLASAETLPC